jgi:hypothetical protein
MPPYISLPLFGSTHLFSVATTSEDVKSLPSCHFTSLRSRNVHCIASGVDSHDSAKAGLGVKLSSTLVRESYSALHTMALFCEMIRPGSKLSDAWPSLIATLIVPPLRGAPPTPELSPCGDFPLLHPAKRRAPRPTPPDATSI